MKTIFLLFFCFPMQILHSQTIQVLQERESYFFLAETLQQKYAAQSLTKEITFEYSFVTITLKTSFGKEINTWLSVRISKAFSILEVACMDKKVEKEVVKFIRNFEKLDKKIIGNQWLKKINTVETIEYLAEADQIAKIGSSCSGTYAPSYYSKIQIDEAKISLEQIDYQNTKSLDKENYSMRTLFFEIEYLKNSSANVNNESSQIAYQVSCQYKSIKICFNDLSSPSYQECGRKIAQAIKELAQKK